IRQLVARSEAFMKVVAAEAALKHYLPLVEKVVTQSQARIFQAQTRHPDKILSLFEPHSVVIRKGKAHKPNEFGRLVRIDEVENGFVSNYACRHWKITWNCSVKHPDWLPLTEASGTASTRRPPSSWESSKWFYRLVAV